MTDFFFAVALFAALIGAVFGAYQILYGRNEIAAVLMYSSFISGFIALGIDRIIWNLTEERMSTHDNL